MNARDILLVRESHGWIEPIAEQAAAQFYDRVFERAPSVATLFAGDMAHQGVRLMAMIGAAVELLHDLPKLDGVLEDLGRRHAGYGVKAAHYEVVGGALLDSLATALAPEFTPDHRLAWAALYGHVSRTMQGAAASRSGGTHRQP